jgi:hypothetical protein
MPTPLDWFAELLGAWIGDNPNFYRPINYWYYDYIYELSPTPLDWLWDVFECFIKFEGKEAEE